MNPNDKHQANNSSDLLIKPPGPGRPKGSRNKSTVDGKKYFGRHARKLMPKLIARAAEEAEKADGDLTFAHNVGKLVSEYAWGKPQQNVTTDQTVTAYTTQVSGLSLEGLKTLTRSEEPGEALKEALGPDAEKVASGLNYLLGAQAAANPPGASVRRPASPGGPNANSKTNGHVKASDISSRAPKDIHNGQAPDAKLKDIDFGDGLIAVCRESVDCKSGPGHNWVLERREGDKAIKLKDFHLVAVGDAERRIWQWVKGRQKEGAL